MSVKSIPEGKGKELCTLPEEAIQHSNQLCPTAVYKRRIDTANDMYVVLWGPFDEMERA